MPMCWRLGRNGYKMYNLNENFASAAINAGLKFVRALHHCRHDPEARPLLWNLALFMDEPQSQYDLDVAMDASMKEIELAVQPRADC